MNHLQLKKTWIKSTLSYLSIGKTPGKIPELDGLRAWAILLVLGHHFVTYYREFHGSYYRHVITGPIENWLLNGWLGVDLFFVLSGYLIFHHLMSMERQAQNQLDGQVKRLNLYFRYALKRILRTFPLYYAMILIAFLGLIPYFQPTISWSDLLIHVVFLQDHLGSNILTPMWSLATEEKFYLLAPLLLILTKWSIKRSLGFLLVIVLGVMTYRTWQIVQSDQVLYHLHFFQQYRAPFQFAVVSILVGVMIALVEHKRFPTTMSVVPIFTTGLILALLLFVSLYNVAHWHWLSVTHFLVVLLFGVLVWSAVKLTGTVRLRLLTGRLLRIISVLSYSLYLVHYAVLPWTYRLHKQYIYNETPWVHVFSFLLIYIALTLLIGLVLHYLVEKPFLLLKEKL